MEGKDEDIRMRIRRRRLEPRLCQMADILRSSMGAAQHTYGVLRIINLKSVLDAFNE